MAKTPKSKPASQKDEPVPLDEPVEEEFETCERGDGPWLRGLWMLLFMVLFQLAQWVLGAATLLQFLWLLFAKEKNGAIADFGASLADWMRKAARFNTGATESKPFPFAPWGD